MIISENANKLFTSAGLETNEIGLIQRCAESNTTIEAVALNAEAFKKAGLNSFSIAHLAIGNFSKKDVPRLVNAAQQIYKSLNRNPYAFIASIKDLDILEIFAKNAKLFKNTAKRGITDESICAFCNSLNLDVAKAFFKHINKRTAKQQNFEIDIYSIESSIARLVKTGAMFEALVELNYALKSIPYNEELRFDFHKIEFGLQELGDKAKSPEAVKEVAKHAKEMAKAGFSLAQIQNIATNAQSANDVMKVVKAIPTLISKLDRIANLETEVDKSRKELVDLATQRKKPKAVGGVKRKEEVKEAVLG